MSAEERYEALLQFLYQCPYGLAETDETGKVLMLNASASQLLMPFAMANQLDPQNVVETLHFFEPSLKEKIKAYSEAYGLIVSNFRIRLHAQPDSEIYISLHLLKLSENRLQFSFKDVSDIIQLEKEQTQRAEREALQAGKLEMATGILHDIGNAITAFGTHATKLDSGTEWKEVTNLGKLQGLIQKQAAALDTALGAGKGAALGKFVNALHQELSSRSAHLKGVQKSLLETTSHVQEILNIQRHYVKGNLKGTRAPVNIRQVLNDALSIQRQSLEKRDIQLAEQVPLDLPHISGDQTKLIQAIVNIVKNTAEAFDEMLEDSERHLRISVAADAEQLQLQFADNACGFSPEIADQLFEKGHTSKSSGTGFGLFNVKQIIESHGGQIAMQSEGPGLGATTSISFPLNN